MKDKLFPGDVILYKVVLKPRIFEVGLDRIGYFLLNQDDMIDMRYVISDCIWSVYNPRIDFHECHKEL